MNKKIIYSTLLIPSFLYACDKTKPNQGATASSVTASAAVSTAMSTMPSASSLMPKDMRPSIPAPPDVAAPPADAIKTASGLASKVVQAGTGKEHPEEQDNVKIHFTAWSPDGKTLDSSTTRGAPAELPLKDANPGWIEGIQLMVVGEKRRLWIPSNLVHRNRPGAPPAPANGMVVFDIELIDIRKGPKPIPAPADVAAPPKDAEKTKTNLASKVLQKGTGKVHPKATNSVQVHYTGWTTDGKMFDSSVTHGQPATFVLNGVIPGWTEGMQLMVEGEKRRFWIPEELAYKGQPGTPAGMLVFDVELLKIVEATAVPSAMPTPPPRANALSAPIHPPPPPPGSHSAPTHKTN